MRKGCVEKYELTSLSWGRLERQKVGQLLKNIRKFLWNLKIRYSDHKSPSSPVPILKHINPTNTIHSYLTIVNSITYYPPIYVLVFLVALFFLSFPPITLIHSSHRPCYMPLQFHLPWFDRPNCAKEIPIVQFSVLWTGSGVTMLWLVKALCYKPEGRGFGTRWGEFLNLPNPSVPIRPWSLLSL
jgi:hypothetical protein